LGTKVTLVFIGLADARLSIMRVADRVLGGGHDVPIEAIVRRYYDSLARLTLVWGLADRAYLIDNSGPRRRLILSRDADGIRHASCSAPHWARIALPMVSWDLEGGEAPADGFGI
jgi:predicted ABC-type ATPase